MKIFISWSGLRSRETAELLSSWIRKVIQAAETWMSNYIEKGTKWNEILNKELEETRFGILCLNRDNLDAEWLLFEAGALSKSRDAHVCTFLLDVKPTDVKPPLGQFQHTAFSKEDMKKLIYTINSKVLTLNEKGLSEGDLSEVFEIFWPKLEERLLEIQALSAVVQQHARTEREILEEILQTVRTNYYSDVWQDLLNDLLNGSGNLKIDEESLRNFKVRYAYKDNQLTRAFIEHLIRTKLRDTHENIDGVGITE